MIIEALSTEAEGLMTLPRSHSSAGKASRLPSSAPLSIDGATVVSARAPYPTNPKLSIKHPQASTAPPASYILADD
ncbi:hypothetical protein P7K49_012701 [Saguinus oedipus]|uniref:Uncharacterized protein n=1 Tax=Saguinus oedipus TaxID=9490 RepID=A0ABQ9VE34_SAGOE|nr:hypothetical protein P7K49_012701 [Saguinus oedipus]